MYFSRFILSFLLLVLLSCGTDLAPSATDKHMSDQHAPDFTLSDTLGNTVTLSSVLSAPSTSGVVMYFTMWCPTCTTDMDLMRDWIMPNFPHVRFFAVDYVSATVAQARDAEVSNGFDGSGFIVLADTDLAVSNLYNAGMATTVVIDRNGVIRMNELYKSDKLQSVLGTLQ